MSSSPASTIDTVRGILTLLFPPDTPTTATTPTTNAISLIALGGPGGTGKSTFAQQLAQSCASLCIALDDYRLPRALRQQMAETPLGSDPRASNIPLLLEHVTELRSGATIEKPRYNPRTGESSLESVQPTHLTFIEGELATHEPLREAFDFFIFVESHWKTQLTTRITRDIDQHGAEPATALDTFIQSNLTDFPRYGAAARDSADIILYCHDDYRLSITACSSRVHHLCPQIPLIQPTPTATT